MRLVHAKRDFVRLQIMSRKLAKKQLNLPGFDQLKIQYYQFMVLYFIHEKMHIDTAKSF